MTYSPFWSTVQAFQSLIGAGVSLLAVVGAISGILLKTRLDERLVARKDRQRKHAKAASICLWIETEKKLPDGGLLRVPTEAEVVAMLVSPIGTSIGASKVIEYHTNMTTGLAEYPHPIADRASFISWTSARTILAIAQVSNVAESERNDVARKYAENVSLLIRVGIKVMVELSKELDLYCRFQDKYENAWAKKPGEGFHKLEKGMRYENEFFSRRFDSTDVYQDVVREREGEKMRAKEAARGQKV